MANETWVIEIGAEERCAIYLRDRSNASSYFSFIMLSVIGTAQCRNRSSMVTTGLKKTISPFAPFEIIEVSDQLKSAVFLRR